MAATSGNKACVLKLSRVAWRKQLRHKCVFQCGGKKCLLRAPCKPDEVKDVARRMRNVAEHVIDRVDSEFPEIFLRIRCRMASAFLAKLYKRLHPLLLHKPDDAVHLGHFHAQVKVEFEVATVHEVFGERFECGAQPLGDAVKPVESFIVP